MTTQTYRRFQTKVTPQSQAIPGSAQVANSAGGYSFALDQWKLLDRFLILGSEGGTYYIGEQKLTEQNALNVIKCILADGLRTVKTIVDISLAGRAPKNDPALFALALAASKGSPETKAAALAALPQVARIGTHLFHFAAYVEQFRGWGRSLRTAIGNWYLSKSPIALAKQVTKYQSRDGWSHRDLLRLAHVKPSTPEYNAIFQYVVKGTEPAFEESGTLTDSADYINAVEVVKHYADAPTPVVDIIAAYELPREVLPTELLTRADVWEALLPHMGLMAMIRNLGNLSKVGLLTQMSDAEKLVRDKLADTDTLKKERVHPLAILIAQKVYGQGHSVKGSGTWDVVPRVIDSLNDAFYATFGLIEPTGKRTLLGLDVSASMSGHTVQDVLTCAEAAAAMAMVTARVESEWGVMAFADGFRKLPITPKMSLAEILRHTENVNFGGTDCALPMLWALKNRVAVDAFYVYTDNETWAGHIHPPQALNQYRQQTGIPAKLIVVGMAANEFTIADPADAGMLDVVGFDASAPAVMADFIRE